MFINEAILDITITDSCYSFRLFPNVLWNCFFKQKNQKNHLPQHQQQQQHQGSLYLQQESSVKSVAKSSCLEFDIEHIFEDIPPKQVEDISVENVTRTSFRGHPWRLTWGFIRERDPLSATCVLIPLETTLLSRNIRELILEKNHTSVLFVEDHSLSQETCTDISKQFIIKVVQVVQFRGKEEYENTLSTSFQLFHSIPLIPCHDSIWQFV